MGRCRREDGAGDSEGSESGDDLHVDSWVSNLLDAGHASRSPGRRTFAVRRRCECTAAADSVNAWFAADSHSSRGRTTSRTRPHHPRLASLATRAGAGHAAVNPAVSDGRPESVFEL